MQLSKSLRQGSWMLYFSILHWVAINHKIEVTIECLVSADNRQRHDFSSISYAASISSGQIQRMGQSKG